ncbi:ribose-5-phosphate isomerase A, partial [Microcystis aeruginosa]
MTMTNSEVIVSIKQAVGKMAAERVQSDTIVGLGTGSTTVFAIQHLGERLKNGEIKNIVGIPTSFQSENLARECGIPLTTLNAVDHIDLAIDGADEVDP